MNSESNDMDLSIYEEMYRQVSNLPFEERLEILKAVAPPQVLFSKLDGTLFRIRVLGLTMFDTKALLTEAGIKKDDPRSVIFKYLKGSLIDAEILKTLRNISARQDTVSKDVGGISIRGDDKRSKVWWIPINSTSSFKKKTKELQDEIWKYVQDTLINPYDIIKQEARTKYEDAVKAAYDSLKDKQTIEALFIEANMKLFEEKFPSMDKVGTIRMEVFPIQTPLPPTIENTLTELAKLQREKNLSELEVNEIQLAILRAEQEAIEEKNRTERALRREMLQAQISPEIQKVTGIIGEIEKTIAKISSEIFDAIKKGVKISSSQRRSWKNTIEQLSALSMTDYGDFDQALEQLKSMATATESYGAGSIVGAKQIVSKALSEIEHRANLDIQGAALWQMIEYGDSESLIQINNLKDKISEDQMLLESLEDVATNLGADIYIENMEVSE